MKPLESKLASYLKSLSEKDFSLEPSQEEKNLPLYLGEHYELREVKWLGREVLLALEKPGWELGSPKEYRNQTEQIRKLLGRPLVLVIPEITASVRNRLVDMRIPFIVPGAQLFIPEVWMELQEKYPGMSGAKNSKSFTPTAQLMLLYHLQRGKIDNLTGKDLAKQLGCTPAMISKCREEFEQKELCELVRVGKSIQMHFKTQGRALWEKALPYLSSPVQERHWVQHTQENEKLHAGITALSKRSMLADDKIPTICLHRNKFNKDLKAGILQTCPDADQAIFKLEAWTYNPMPLSRNGQIDTLSLWLSLRDDPDERVQGQLTTIFEDVEWQ
jgi:DNA-binding MarR family transcriptional regulator